MIFLYTVFTSLNISGRAAKRCASINAGMRKLFLAGALLDTVGDGEV